MHENIIRTLSYAAVFEFPLTLVEIHQRLIGKSASLKNIKKILKKSRIKSFRGFYYVGKKTQVDRRIKNQIYQQAKLKIAKKIANSLKIFPSIKAILITGAVAANNATKDDDIDFLIITTPNTLWITRLLTNIFLTFKNQRRSKKAKKVRNLACLNLWLTTNSLSMPKKRQNLYTAYEISLAKLVWQKDQTYQKFIYQNRWIHRFLPNTHIPEKPTISSNLKYPGIINYLAFIFQSLYMKSNQTNESISISSAFFHPRNTRKEVEKKYRKIYQQHQQL